MPGGNPQHNNWAGSERQITKENVHSLQLLYRYKTDNPSDGFLSSPSVVGNLITYLGFKEMLLFTGSSGRVYSVDADLSKPVWESHLPGTMTAPLISAGSSASSLHFAALASEPPRPPGAPPPRRNPYLPPLDQTLSPMLPTTLTRLNAMYTVSGDGFLHIVNSSTGEDLLPAVRFLAPGTRVIGLNLHDNVVYATTPAGLYAVDLMSPQKTVTSFSPASGEFAGTQGATLADDGTVYVECAYSPDGKRPYEAVLALRPKDLLIKDYFLMGKLGKEPAGITPAVFNWGGRELIVAASREGKLYLLDIKSMGGANHKTPLYAGKLIKGNARGAFSTWLDVETGLRRVYVPIFGRTGNDSVAAFLMQGTREKPSLQRLWLGDRMAAPAPVVIANGMVFVLATGDAAIPTQRKPATLHAFDAATGQSLFNGPGAPVSSPLSGGLAVANGRVYFTARDNSAYCFGIADQQMQLRVQ